MALVVFRATTERDTFRVLIDGDHVLVESRVDGAHVVARLSETQAVNLAASLLVAIAPEALAGTAMATDSPPAEAS